ncbi:DnaJ domain-containing protein [Natrarchaeobius oligotrophus]|uniref:J domain-containing protein n=1 Tax=Natrarchaeobius chitinivorans TaxID=1679083 RepID=A0A3N6PJ56_NATCH|nr:DnaJ domain-containing protein [Natrarchaeobius chitinivorans]RQG98475.1 J domain-containing protein [Natrarchaeobius chitinivorans]
MTADFYDLLDVPPDASQDDIKEAYREKVRIYHPDVNDDDRARAQFTAVKKAHDILGDPVERQAYDRLGHADYVAKRTSGIPSPDVWADSDDASTDADGSRPGDETTDADARSSNATSARASTESTSESASGSGSTSRTGSGSSGASSSRTRTNADATDSRRQRRTGWTNGTDDSARSEKTSTTSAANDDRSSSTGSEAVDAGSSTNSADARNATGTGTDGAVSSTDGGTARGHHRSDRAPRSSSKRAGDGNSIVRWWRRRNVALPLIWLSVMLYAVGLAHFALENERALTALGLELAGADGLGAVASVFSSGRYGVETPVEFVASVEPVAPPLSGLEWYVALAGVVAAAIVIVLLSRLWFRDRVRGPISIDETILVALALAVSTGLVGGPLLAGAVCMPFLFGVIVHHTRRSPGWKPSYLYVLPVLAPIGGIVAGIAGYATLSVDLMAFVLLPAAGALGLPLRATIRKHLGR